MGGFTVAEQLIGAQGHDIIGYTPRPNQIVAWSAQTLLHGATAVSFFRWRAAVFGQEEFCYGVLDQTTEQGAGRKWKEAQALYALARSHQNLWLQPVAARVVVLYDTENNFMWQGQPQSTAFSFEGEAHRLYYPFWRQGAAIDVLASERALRLWPTADALLDQYRVILLPSPMYISDELAPVLEEFVVKGGALWIGFRSDLKDLRLAVSVDDHHVAARTDTHAQYHVRKRDRTCRRLPRRRGTRFSSHGIKCPWSIPEGKQRQDEARKWKNGEKTTTLLRIYESGTLNHEGHSNVHLNPPC